MTAADTPDATQADDGRGVDGKPCAELFCSAGVGPHEDCCPRHDRTTR